MGEKASFWLVVGGGLIALGSFLPWITATTVFGTISRNGVSDGGDGVFTMVLGVVIGVLGGMLASGGRTTTATRVILWLAVIAFALIWVVDFTDVRDRIGLVDSEFAAGGIGMGFWVMAIGGVVTIVGLLNLPASGGSGEGGLDAEDG